MNTINNVLTTSTLFLLLASTSYAKEFEATNDYITTQICVAAAEGHRARLYKTIKDSGLSKIYVANEVKCNDQPITAFVTQHGKSPEAINTMLNKYRKNKNTKNSNLVKL